MRTPYLGLVGFVTALTLFHFVSYFDCFGFNVSAIVVFGDFNALNNSIKYSDWMLSMSSRFNCIYRKKNLSCRSNLRTCLRNHTEFKEEKLGNLDNEVVKQENKAYITSKSHLAL